jgi:hypothetical protein
MLLKLVRDLQLKILNLSYIMLWIQKGQIQVKVYKMEVVEIEKIHVYILIQGMVDV